MGIALIILGMFMIGAPLAAGVAGVVIIGCLMVVRGAVECAHAVKAGSWAARIAWAVVGIVTALCGLLVLAHPLFGLTTLTLLVAAYFLVKGIVTIAYAFKNAAARGWFLFNGVISLLLGCMIWSSWPLSGSWAVGTLVGIDTLFSGFAVVMAPRPPQTIKA